jgi:hypothetical protein
MQRQEYRQKDGDYYYCYYRKRSEVGQATIIREAGVIILNKYCSTPHDDF